MSNNNVDFAYAVIHNIDNATEDFKAKPEILMAKFELEDDAKAKLREIGLAWSNGQTEAVAQGWQEFASEFIGPELTASMRW
ncbi:hypothetical protein L1286_12510 [Pseudoalteromonas sp. SMS1]|uniref:Uncharacterized protein n=1 Tax=Pseudoalteromonas luteoviolacea CPMOR-1 TaxID=1365248 RepID=A0A167IPJ8_9GAMM|nr:MULTISPECIES: hypothetical protein [Pseudoalteromonas]KZN59795.1 hypothetical protein N473_02465 [Pseudoalteromonas luteoviolacea CPMOR-1]MCF2858301.1 hypothetical protein [Pseudoalteromonas sp. SMS1]